MAKSMITACRLHAVAWVDLWTYLINAMEVSPSSQARCMGGSADLSHQRHGDESELVDSLTPSAAD